MHYPPSFIFPHIAFQQTSKNLASLLAIEDQRKREFARHANSRHSRFGTTIAVTINPKKAKPPASEGNSVPDEPEAGPSRAFVLHRQQALTKQPGDALDMTRAKKPRKPPGKKVDELTRDDNLSVDSRQVLQNLARAFIENCFNRACLLVFLVH